MSRTPIDLSAHSDREIIMNIVPRLENVEGQIERQDKRQSDLESAVGALRRDLIDTETRLSKRVDDRFDKVDAHLTKQDERLDKVVDEKRKWPQGAIVAVTAICTLLAGLVVSIATHLMSI